MTQRNRECKVQVQAPRVSARIAALTVLALALALTQRSVTPSDHEDDRHLRPTTASHATDGVQHRKKER